MLSLLCWIKRAYYFLFVKHIETKFIRNLKSEKHNICLRKEKGLKSCSLYKHHPECVTRENYMIWIHSNANTDCRNRVMFLTVILKVESAIPLKIPREFESLTMNFHHLFLYMMFRKTFFTSLRLPAIQGNNSLLLAAVQRIQNHSVKQRIFQ